MVTLLYLSHEIIKSKFHQQLNVKFLKNPIAYLQRLFNFFLIIVIYGCCAASSEIMHYNAAENLAKEKFGENFVIEKNNTGSLFLCFKVREAKNQLHTLLHYFIYEAKSQRIIIEEKINDAAVKWFDEHNIKITLTPEIISGDEDETTYILNVITKEIQKRNFIN